MVEFKSADFDGKQKCASLQKHICHEADFLWVSKNVLEAFWPLEPTRMIRLTLNHLKLRNEKEAEIPILAGENIGTLNQFLMTPA